MQKKQKVILLLSELAIPVLGFYLWNWNLYFILLFFCLDMVGSEITLHLKARKVANYKPDHQVSNWKVFAIIGALLLFLNIAFIHIGIYTLHADFDIKKEVVAFLSYKELGIQQGYILIPLIAMMAISQYLGEFIAMKQFERTTFKELFKQNFQLKFAVLIFSALLSVVVLSLHPQEEVLLWLILIPVSIVNWLNKD